MKRAVYRALWLIPLGLSVFSSTAFAQDATGPVGAGGVSWVVVVAAAAAIPLLGMMLSAFVKIAVVLSILRMGFGANGVPSAQIVFGLSLILALFAMAPVIDDMWTAGKAAYEAAPPEASQIEMLEAVVARSLEPLETFLGRHAHASDVALFASMSPEGRAPDSIAIIGPAFVTSELKEAFQIGFLILLPFLVIDLVVANVLGVTGLQSLSPAMISLPLKLLLFVLVDGWYLIARGLIEPYVSS
ncbi:MAG: EscR/YscR/HrcR family type III secretion system export apparatus protein [Myxococcales bacterium]|nr:EscR/YscR/HrcR family type III secretion system export apparatus protein [Myxococcales bacterium]